MKIKNVAKLFGAVATVVAAIVVTDKIIDTVADKVLEKKCYETMDKAAEIDDKIETMVEECKKTEKNVNFYRTCTKYTSKALIILGTIAVAHEYGLEMGVVSGAAFFTKVPTTYENACKLVTEDDSFHEVMRLVRSVG